MKTCIVLMFLFYSLNTFGQEPSRPSDLNYSKVFGNKTVDEGLGKLYNYLEKANIHKPQINFYPDTGHRFSIISGTDSILISQDSVIDKAQEAKFTKLYAYIIAHCIAHYINNSFCDTIPYQEFSADCISGYLLKNAGIISEESELAPMIDDSLLQVYFNQHNELRRFERYFALSKGIKDSGIGIKDYMALAKKKLVAFKNNVFDLNDIDFECTLDNGARYYIGFPNYVYLKENETFASVGSTTALDTSYWYYWLRMQIGDTVFYMDGQNRVRDNYGKVVGKIVRVED